MKPLDVTALEPLRQRVFDSHAHLADAAFDGILDEVIARARSAGVEGVINLGDTLPMSQKALKQARRYPDFIRAAVGIHPYEASQYSDKTEAALEKLAVDELICAIGEIGLDYVPRTIDYAPRDVQRNVFRRQLALARNLNLPVAIHCRNAYDDLIEILETEVPNGTRGVVHCFSGNSEDARRILDLGFYIAFTGTITFKNAGALRKIASVIPLERILIETDSPYLTPHPYRGARPNEPAYVRFIAEAISALRELPLEDVCRITTQNVHLCFGIKSSGASEDTNSQNMHHH